MRSNPIRPRHLICSSTAAVMLAMGCSTPPPPVATPKPDELAGAPTWVLNGCRHAPSQANRAKLCSIGAFAGSSNIAIAKSASVTRGRNNIARNLKSKVRKMLEDYVASTPQGSSRGAAKGGESEIGSISKRITDVSLPVIEVEDTWISESGTV